MRCAGNESTTPQPVGRTPIRESAIAWLVVDGLLLLAAGGCSFLSSLDGYADGVRSLDAGADAPDAMDSRNAPDGLDASDAMDAPDGLDASDAMDAPDGLDASDSSETDTSLPDPCLGVVCDGRFARECVNSSTLRIYAGPAECVDGGCVNPHADYPCSGVCPDGCAREGCSSGWMVQPLSFAPRVGDEETTAIAVSNFGEVHVSFFYPTTGDLIYARSPGWSAQRVDADDAGLDVSLALDSAGGVHLTYLDTGRENLKYAYLEPGGSWNVSVMDPRGGFFGPTSVGVDRSGAVHATYSRNGVSLVYAHKPAGGEWKSSDLDTTVVPLGASLAIGPDDAVHVAYSTGAVEDPLKYAYRPASGSWVTTEVDDTNVAFPSLASERSGDIHVSYSRGGSTPGDMMYARKPHDGSEWALELVDVSSAQRSSIAVDLEGRAHIAHGGPVLWYAHKPPGGAWTTESTAPLAWVDGVSLAVDNFGRAHVAAYTSEGVVFAFRCHDP